VAAPRARGALTDARRNVVTVAKREFVERFRDRSFLISTGVVLLILLAVTVLPRLLGFGDPSTWKVGLVGGASAPLAQAVPAAQQAVDARIEVRTLSSAAAEAAVRDGQVDLAVVDGARLLALDDPPPPLVALVRSAVREQGVQRALVAAGVSPEVVRRAQAVPPLPLTALERRGDPVREAAARFGSILLYFQLLTYGMWVAAGVVEEKASRVVEILLAAIRPAHLLAGKIIGIGLLGLTQLAFLALVGVGASVAFGLVQLPASLAGTAAVVLGWFVLGFAFYAGAFAVAGAIVSRQEELQNTATPLSLLMVAAFLVSLGAAEDPGSLLARVVTFLPPVAPLVVPLRVAAGEIGALEQVAAVVVMVAATVAMVPLAARIYAGAVLRTGGRVKLRQALQSG
jgi:ABC-2 type transport system permease protein